MAKMSQKELVEEGFSDKIRGIAKAVKTGVKQAAQQGVNLDTGQLTTGMYKSYKGEQPVAFLKKALENDKEIGIVKIDKSNIKKQQASGKKGYIGRIVGPKTVTLIPFEGTLYNKRDRQYEGPSAGAIKEGFAPEDAELTDVPRDEKGRIKAVHKDGGIEKQIHKLLLKHGVEESAAARLSPYAAHIRRPILQIIQKTHPQIKFTFNPKPEIGGFDVEKASPDIAEVKPDDFRAKTESLSLRDITQLSGEVLIVEASKRQIEMRKRAKDAGVVASRYKTLDELQKAVEAAEKANAAEEGFKERNPEEPVVELEKEKPEEPVYPGHEKFVASLDDKVVLDLLKLKQKIQPGLQIKFEETGPESDYQGETGMFVAEIFRTKDGLQLGDIYRQEDPTDVVRGERQIKKKEEVKQSPFDKAVETLKTKNNLKANTLAAAIKNIDDVNTITNITGKKEGVRLSDEDIVNIKNELIKQRIIKEKSSQKILLRQLTSLS